MQYRDDSKHNHIGNGNLDAVIVDNLGFGDAVGASINLASDLGHIAGEDPKKAIKKQTYVIEAAGGATSKVMLTLNRYMVDETGAALASGTVVSIGGTDYTCGAGGVIAHEIDGGVKTTLHDFVAAINELPGFNADVLHALTTQDMDSAAFIAVAETVLADAFAGGVDTLFRDASASFVTLMRIGLPRAQDKDALQLMQIKGACTDVTNGTVKLIRDDDDEYIAGGAHQEVYLDDTMVAALTAYLDDNVLEAQTIRGSVVLEVKSDDLTAASFGVKYRQGQVCHGRKS